MSQNKKPLFKRNEKDIFNHRPGLFAVTPILPQLIIIAIVVGVYCYIQAEGYFPLWITWIYYAVKIIVALEIIVAAAKSLFVPVLAIVLGALNLYLLQVKGFEYVSFHSSWQLVAVGIAACFLTFIVRSSKYRR